MNIQLGARSLDCTRVTWHRNLTRQLSQPCIGRQPLPCRAFFWGVSSIGNSGRHIGLDREGEISIDNFPTIPPSAEMSRLARLHRASQTDQYGTANQNLKSDVVPITALPHRHITGDRECCVPPLKGTKSCESSVTCLTTSTFTSSPCLLEVPCLHDARSHHARTYGFRPPHV